MRVKQCLWILRVIHNKEILLHFAILVEEDAVCYVMFKNIRPYSHAVVHEGARFKDVLMLQKMDGLHVAEVVIIVLEDKEIILKRSLPIVQVGWHI